MRTYRERPRNRKNIEKYLASNPHISLKDIARGFYIDGSGHRKYLGFTDGMRTQSRKMLSEVKKNSRVRIEGKYIGLDTGNKNYIYRFGLNECDTERKILHWVHHLSRKSWVTKKILDDFVVSVCQHHNINIVNRNLKPAEKRNKQ